MSYNYYRFAVSIEKVLPEGRDANDLSDVVIEAEIAVEPEKLEAYVEKVRKTLHTKKQRRAYDGAEARREYALAVFHDLVTKAIGEWDGGAKAIVRSRAVH